MVAGVSVASEGIGPTPEAIEDPLIAERQQGQPSGECERRRAKHDLQLAESRLVRGHAASFQYYETMRINRRSAVARSTPAGEPIILATISQRLGSLSISVPKQPPSVGFGRRFFFRSRERKIQFPDLQIHARQTSWEKRKEMAMSHRTSRLTAPGGTTPIATPPGLSQLL